MITSLSPQQLRRAAALKERIQSLEKELNHLLGSTVISVPKKKKFKFGAAAKAKVSAAAKLRWAKIKSPSTPTGNPGTRKFENPL